MASDNKVADLHTHTTYSDGTCPPERIVELAHKAGICALSVTDHDTMAALPRCSETAKRFGVELIPGIEMSASADDTEVHVLGLMCDPASKLLMDHIEEQTNRRHKRAREMVRRLKEAGIKITAEEVFELAGEGTVARPHVARALLKHGYVSTTAEAFERYLGPKNPAFVPGSPLSPADVISIVRRSGGIPVLAHPIFLENDTLIEAFVKDGLAGLEVYHSSHRPQDVLRYEKIANQFGLLITGGSDFHGEVKEGGPIGGVTVSYALVDALKRWKAKHVS